MKRKIHAIYDIILKMIIMEYSNDFLKFIGIEKSIKKVLKTTCVMLGFKLPEIEPPPLSDASVSLIHLAKL